jgi:gliding motility-associated protein GldM
MAGYKETPRQKMIGMMYLVLTALLALNVSKQILDAFVVVNDSMETTNNNFGSKIDNTYSKFKVQYQLNPNKVGPYFEKAQLAHKLSADLAHYVDSLKWMVLKETERLETYEEAKTFPLSKAARKDNFDTPTNYFIQGSHDGTNCRAAELRKKIEAYRKNMLDLLDPKYRETMKIGLET